MRKSIYVAVLFTTLAAFFGLAGTLLPNEMPGPGVEVIANTSLPSN